MLNKIDRLESAEFAQDAIDNFADTVAVSALSGEGIDKLLPLVHKKLFESFLPIEVLLPFSQGGLTAMFHEQGQVEEVEHTREGVRIVGRIPGRLVAQFKDFEYPPEPDLSEEE